MSVYIKALQEWGVKGTFRHLYMFKRIKMGTCVGVDVNGNKYFENKEYPYGQHRWVEHKNWEGQQLAEASEVPPVWHGWLHSMVDEPPVDNQPNTSLTGKKIAEGEHNTVKNHYNTEHLKAWRPNPTLKRERGYKIGSTVSGPGENGFYTQKGHPMNPHFEAEEEDIESWTGAPSGGASEVKVSEDEERWQKFYKQRQQMNQK